MKLSINLIPKFKHKCPKGTHYEVEQHNRDMLSIWICYDRVFDYNLGKKVRCIWGFYSIKNYNFYSPVNSSKVGKMVNFADTRPWSSMKLNYQGIEQFFV